MQNKMPADKKKLAIIAILLLGATDAGVAGTAAFFTAQRTVQTNRFAAGTLDLNVASNNVSLQPFVLENLGENGNLSGSKTWTVKNTGSLPGRLLVRLTNLTNAENGCANDQETSTEPTCSAQGDVGDLGAKVNLNVTVGGTQVATSTLANANLAAIGTQWNGLTPLILAPNQEVTVGANWALGEDSYGNEVQGDAVSFDVDFRLIQQIAGPTPTN